MGSDGKGAYDQAVSILREADIKSIIDRSGAYVTKDGLGLSYFNRQVEITLPDVTFTKGAAGPVDKLIILHYLTSRGNENTCGEYVGYKDLPGGMFYYPAYFKQGPARIAKRFGGNPPSLIEAAARLGAEKAGFGDASVKLSILPNVKVLIVVYKSDAEFPQEAFILYRDDVINYLSLKDISMLSGEIVSRLEGKNISG